MEAQRYLIRGDSASEDEKKIGEEALTNITKDLDFWKEFSWVDKKSFLCFLGMDENSFDCEPLERKICDLVLYYGYENVYGAAYNPTVIRGEE